MSSADPVPKVPATTKWADSWAAMAVIRMGYPCGHIPFQQQIKSSVRSKAFVFLGVAFTQLFPGCGKGEDPTPEPSPVGVITDVEGNGYRFASIGTQVWMIENLRTGHYRDGSAITQVTDTAAWIGLETEAFCSYENNPDNDPIRGNYYNWYALTDPRGLCPPGWHVPSDPDWDTLSDYLGGWGVAGGKMKAVSPLWLEPNAGATNESGFTALPTGLRNGYNGFFSFGSFMAYWWSVSSDSTSARSWHVINDETYLGGSNIDRRYGLCVRCLQD